jgi:hypothetical protein
MRRTTRWALLLCVLIAATSAASAFAATTSAAKIQAYERQARRHESTLRFFANRPWMTVPSKTKCWQATGWHRRKTCRIARAVVAEHKARLTNVRQMISKLSEVQGPTGNESNWLCIHGYERNPAQGWATNTGNGYYGGLQMDMSFQRAHGLDLLLKKGTANNWTAHEQMVVAQRAHDGVRTYYDDDAGRVKTYQERGRGYNPWPNTARYCGLL